MIERFRKAELSKLKLAFEKDYELYEKSNFAHRHDVRERLFLPKWGTCIPIPFIVDKIVGWYKEAAVRNPKVKIYDVGAGTGMLLVMLYLAGIPYDALVGIDLPRECLCEETPRYWKMIEDSSFQVPKDDILLISYGEQLNHALKSYLVRGGSNVILIGSESKDKVSFQQPPTDIFVDRPGWVTELHMLPCMEFHGSIRDIITHNTARPLQFTS